MKIIGMADGMDNLPHRGEPSQAQHLADVDQVLVHGGHANGGVDQCRPQAAQRHGNRGGQVGLGEHRVIADIHGTDDDGHQWQPGQRRNRFEDLHNRIDGSIYIGTQPGQHMPSGTAIMVASMKPVNTVKMLVRIWSK